MTKQSLKQMVHICILFTLILCLGLLAAPARALTPLPLEIVVNSTGDEPDQTNDNDCLTASGDCTLRAAIMHANHMNSTGDTVITFNILGSIPDFPTTIYVSTALPSLDVPGITIQGPNLDGNSVLVLDGNIGSYPGLTIKADNCSIRKLTFANFGSFGILAEGTDTDTVTGTLIIGNTIGDMVPKSYFDVKPNGGGIKLFNTTRSTIGGETSADRNVISGNNGPGILIYGGSTNFVLGNYVGVKSDGLTPLPNTSGVFIEASSDNSIGGNTVGRRNIISGNSADGIFLFANNNLVQGNYIGTDASGTIAVPNGGDGVWVSSTSPENAENQIGGPGPGQGNLISGNTLSGINVEASDDNIIQGNIIGLNAAQSAVLPNLIGITLKAAWTNWIGGSIAGAGNVIAGNEQQGILVHGNELGEACYDTSILGNFIGLSSSGQAFTNGLDGILLEDYSHGTNIGGNNDADENTIAYNGGSGIAIEAAYAKVMGNKLYENEGLGIDVWTNTDQKGVTPNDSDESDSVQNFPIITNISFPIPGRVLIAVEVPSPLEGKDVRVNLFASDTCDPSGHGEGQVYLGHVMDIVVDGKADFAISLAQPRSFMYYTATAWTVSKGQSEFSACKSLNLYLPAILK